MPTTLVIDRKKWVRCTGEDVMGRYGFSNLLNKRGSMCCLGFACLKVGLTKEVIRGHSSPNTNTIRNLLNSKTTKLSELLKSIDVTNQLIEINDNFKTDDAYKEKEIKRIFRENGLRVRFIN